MFRFCGGLLLAICLWVPTMAQAKLAIEVKGLFSNGAVLVINGRQRMLRQGKTSPEGVTLIAADSKSAVVEIDGQRQTLTLSHMVGGTYAEPTRAEVRLPTVAGGHYQANGVINGLSVKFLVDTGATSIVFNSSEARRLGINYDNGPRVSVHTASGSDVAYEVTLPKVTVGTITLTNVVALVMEGPAPSTNLLGNTFLSRVNMRVDEGVLVLQAKY